MSAEFIAILGVGVALAGLILSGRRSVFARMDRLEDDLRSEIRSVGDRVNALAERVSRLEGAFAFVAPRFSEPGPERPEPPA